MRGAVRTLLECVGEDPDREGLLDTPSRYAKALMFFTKGYQANVDDIGEIYIPRSLSPHRNPTTSFVSSEDVSDSMLTFSFSFQ